MVRGPAIAACGYISKWNCSQVQYNGSAKALCRWALALLAVCPCEVTWAKFQLPLLTQSFSDSCLSSTHYALIGQLVVAFKNPPQPLWIHVIMPIWNNGSNSHYMVREAGLAVFHD